MKVAISYQNGRNVSGHAGRCNRFKVYTIQDNKIASSEDLEFSDEIVFHNVFHDRVIPFNEHPLHGIDVIITGSMGSGFVAKMAMNGIKAVGTSERDADKAMGDYLNGTLVMVEPSAHHHHH
jgi:predicted Fe-Mo cluster-binding NifX family protein